MTIWPVLGFTVFAVLCVALCGMFVMDFPDFWQDSRGIFHTTFLITGGLCVFLLALLFILFTIGAWQSYLGFTPIVPMR